MVGLPVVMALSIVSWLYIAAVVYVLFLSRLTPEPAVYLRIGSSIISDIIWLPFGVVIWYAAFRLVALVSVRGFGVSARLAGILPPFFAALVFCFFSPDWAFRLFFAAIAIVWISKIPAIVRERAWGRHALLTLPAALLTAIFFLHYGSQAFPPLSSAPRENTIEIMTFNILGDASAADRRNAVESIDRIGADIVCLTEFNPRTDPALIADVLGDTYPYSIANRDESSWRTGEIILSRYPVTGRLDREKNDANFIIAEPYRKKLRSRNEHEGTSRFGARI